MIRKMGRASYPSINQRDVASIKIPLPPLDVQQQIVKEVEDYQKAIDRARVTIGDHERKIQDAIGQVWDTEA